MTKRKMLAIIIALTMCISICGCDVGANTVQETKSYSEQKEEIEETIIEREDRRPFIKRYDKYLTISSDETYFLFETKDKQVYLDFLEDLDEEIYEIVFIIIEHAYSRPTQYRITFTKQ